MDTNAKIQRVRMLMDKAHRLHAAQGEVLKDLCEVLCDLTVTHGPACGVDAPVIAAVIAPKDDPKP